MIDSLLGLVMLMLLTGWMAGVVSIQAMLSSPARSLTPREQVDVLAAVNQSPLAPASCEDLLGDVRKPSTLALLQQLLLAPQLMVRENGQRVNTFMDEQADAGELPYADATDFGKLVSFDDQEAEDWQIELSRPDGDGKSRKERLFLCS